MGLGTDIDTGLPMSLSMNVYAKIPVAEPWRSERKRVGRLPFQN